MEKLLLILLFVVISYYPICAIVGFINFIKRYKAEGSDFRMSKCRYILSEDCNNTDCLSCVLDKIRSEIEQEYKVESEHPYGQGLRRVIEIIDKYMAEGRDKE